MSRLPSASASSRSSRGLTGRKAQILLVEDSPTDAMIIGEILAQASVPCMLHTVEDGLQALQFLRREAEHRAAPRPDLILLDWKLPRKTGPEVLAEIKADEDLRTIPVVVLTSSREQKDVVGAYRLCANSYVTKPVDYGDFAEAVRLIERFWLQLVTLAETD